MRVIGGAAAGTTLVAPSGTRTRPISDLAKESLFGILGDRVMDARILDLYAGTGAIAIEALSRGAAEAVLVERSPPALAAIRTNLARTALMDRAAVRAMTVEAYLQTDLDQPFDLAFCDPPYDIRATLPVVTEARDRLRPGGWLVVKHFWKKPPPAPAGSVVVRTRRFGETALTFLERAESP